MNTSKKVGLVGFGAIGKSILESWQTQQVEGHQLVAILARARQLCEIKSLVGSDILVTDDVDDFLAQGLDVAVEAAGHDAVHALGERLLRAGLDLVVLSVGALVHESTLHQLRNAAVEGGGRMLLPVGAIAGLDGLLALRHAGLISVKYTSVKPPGSWVGTPAEAAFDLDRLTEATIIFSGPALEAAALYPRNANLAAAVALAGIGLERTHVELVADPAVNGPVGRIDAVGASSSLSVVVSGAASETNAKTSAITGLSVLSSLANSSALISFI